jgi:hypothetical protein
MPPDVGAILEEIDDVLRRCGASADSPFLPVATPYSQAAALERGESRATVRANVSAMASSCIAAIERNAPNAAYVRMARELSAGGAPTTSTLERLLGILVSVRQDIQAGYTRALEERVREAVFDDFLDMAEHIRLIHPAPAVVLAGCVLEEHVRKMADAREIELLTARGRPRSFEDLTEALVREDAFRQPQRKILAAWYGQRTEAAHGRFGNVVAEDVPRIIEGVRDFVARHPG